MDARSAATEVFTAEYVRKVLRDGRRASEMVHCLSSGRPFEEESFAAVAMLDVSGYSSFTSSMSVYGKIASEVVTEEVGTYIKKILEIVDNHNGDVVKFLGDAILVTFESRTDELPKDVVTRGMMCCLDVMLNCSNFKVKGTPALWKIIMASSKDQPDRKVDDVYTSIVGSIYSKSGTDHLHEGSTRARPSRPSLVPGTEMHHMGGKRESSLELGDPLSKSTNRSRISLEFAPEPTTGFYIQELKLHTAITVGDIRHTIIGIPAERLDYFIDGGCLHYLFESLAAAKAGELGIAMPAWNLLAAEISLHNLSHFHEDGTGGMSLKEHSFWLIQNSMNVMAKQVKHRPLGKLPPLNTANPISQEHNSVHLFAKFVNAAVLRRMRFDADSNVQELPHQMGDLNTIDQSGSRDIKGLKEFRRISVVFIKLGATFNIKDVQKLITVFLQCIKMSQGVFQQFSVDDKGKSFLAFFGLPPGGNDDCSNNAIRCCTQFFEKIDAFTEGSINVAVTTGDVLFSEIGWSKRKEASVLGDVVNVAARLACLPSTTSGILCDENTWNTVRDTSFSYFGRIYVKGRDGPVNVWERVSTDIRRSMGTEIKSEHVGYEQERDMVARTHEEWKLVGKRTCILIEGESGMGKSKMLEWLLNRLESTQSDYCLIQGSEIESWTPFYAISNLLSYFYKNREILDTNLESRDRASSLLETRSLSLPRRNSTARRTFDEASFSNLISLMKCIGETDEAAIEIADLLPNLGRQRKDATLINKERSASILRRVVEYFVEKCKVVIIIDDAQWMDPVSVEILEAMMQDSDKIFCLLLSRPIDKAVNKISKLCKIDGLSRIQLQGFSKRDLENFFLSKLDQSRVISIHDTIVDEISERGGLRPLFASLLVDRIISCESEWAIDAEGQLCIESGLLQAILEPGISSIVIMQFDRLDPRLQDLLKVSSVLGHYFDIADGVALMANKCAMSVEAWIQFAIDNDTYQFLVKDANNQSFGDHYFRHSFISDAIYESIAYSERETLHARAAEHFEGFLNESNRAFLLPIVSFHYSKSSIMAKNISCLEELGLHYFKSCLYLEARQKLTELIEAFNRFGNNGIEGSCLSMEALNVKKTRIAYWYAVLGNAEAKLRELENAREHALICLTMINEPWPSDNKQTKREIVRGVGRHLYYFWATGKGRRPVKLRRKSVDDEREKVLERAYSTLHLCSSADTTFTKTMRILLLIKSLNVAICMSTTKPTTWGATCLQAAYELSWSLPGLSHTYFRLGWEAARFAGPQIHEFFFYPAMFFLLQSKFNEAEMACRMRLGHATFHNYAMGKLACHLFESEIRFFRGEFGFGTELLKDELNLMFDTDMVLGYASLVFLTSTSVFIAPYEITEKLQTRLEFFLQASYQRQPFPHIFLPHNLLRSMTCLLEKGNILEAVTYFNHFTENLQTLNMVSIIAYAIASLSPFIAWVLICAIYTRPVVMSSCTSEIRILAKALGRASEVFRSITCKRKITVLELPYRFINAAHLWVSGNRGKAYKTIESIRNLRTALHSTFQSDLGIFRPLLPMADAFLTSGDIKKSKLLESLEIFNAIGARNFERFLQTLM